MTLHRRFFDIRRRLMLALAACLWVAVVVVSMTILIVGDVSADERRPTKAICSPVTIEQRTHNGVPVEIEWLDDWAAVYNFEDQRATLNAAGGLRVERMERSSGRTYNASYGRDPAARIVFDADFSGCRRIELDMHGKALAPPEKCRCQTFWP
jgi:hypothetical protein